MRGDAACTDSESLTEDVSWLPGELEDVSLLGSETDAATTGEGFTKYGLVSLTSSTHGGTVVLSSD